MTATELMAQLEDDSDFQRRAREQEAARRQRAAELREAERPVVRELRRAGVEVDSVWDLVNTSEPYPGALPVLINHFERGGYPPRVMESLGRALAVRPAVQYWNRLRTRYLDARDEGEEDGAAVALAACATPAQVDDLIDFLGIVDRGDSRIYFIDPILRHGGDRGRATVEGLRDDPTFGKEASARLRRRR